MGGLKGEERDTKVTGDPAPPRPAGATQPQIAGCSGASICGRRGRGRPRAAVAMSPVSRPHRPPGSAQAQPAQNRERAAPRACAHGYRPAPALGAGEGVTATGGPGITAGSPGEAGPQAEGGSVLPPRTEKSACPLIVSASGSSLRVVSGPDGRARRGLGCLTVGGFVCRGPAAVSERGSRAEKE